MNYLIRISYDGSKYYGFQRLKEKNSIQKNIEEALSKIFKEEIVIKGAGRTDRGVHAYDQCASFKTNQDIPANRLKNAINSLLDDYIYIKECIYVDDDFHARFNVKEKKYIYKINIGEFNPIYNDYIYQPFYKLNINKMKKASKYLLGAHSYKNFVSGKRDNYDSIITKINFKLKNEILVIEFTGKSFYRYMVRNMVGTLLEIGRDKYDISLIKEMLNSNKIYSNFTAPACGLYLKSIKY